MSMIRSLGSVGSIISPGTTSSWGDGGYGDDKDCGRLWDPYRWLSVAALLVSLFPSQIEKE